MQSKYTNTHFNKGKFGNLECPDHRKWHLHLYINVSFADCYTLFPKCVIFLCAVELEYFAAIMINYFNFGM
jgi:hypothetical protein